MDRGEIKWFSPAKGFGFIRPNDGGCDVFVHARIVRAAGLDPVVMKDGTALEYEHVVGKKGAQAVKIALKDNQSQSN